VRTGVYMHLPFCRVRCPYCSFHVYAGLADRIPEYTATLPAELDLRLAGARPTVDTIYFGGGTPSLVRADRIARLLDAVAARVDVTGDAEITLEVDPGSASRERLAGFRSAGVNRVTLGAQTFRPELLAGLGRAHDVPATLRTLDDLRAAGFTDIALDLMFGLAGQSPDDFEADLRRALELEPTHLSLYNLTVEPGTGYDRRRREGTLVLPPEDAQATMYATAVARTREAGLLRYEVSNFAAPEHRSRHNRKHWTGAPYLGLGTGAHGFDPAAGVRWWNVRSLRRWGRAVAAGRLPEAGREELTRAQRLAEAVLVGLRTVEGLDRARFRAEFGVDPGAETGWAGPPDSADGPCVVVDDAAVRLTDAGFLLAAHLADRLLGRLDPPRHAG